MTLKSKGLPVPNILKTTDPRKGQTPQKKLSPVIDSKLHLMVRLLFWIYVTCEIILHNLLSMYKRKKTLKKQLQNKYKMLIKRSKRFTNFFVWNNTRRVDKPLKSIHHNHHSILKQNCTFLRSESYIQL